MVLIGIRFVLYKNWFLKPIGHRIVYHGFWLIIFTTYIIRLGLYFYIGRKKIYIWLVIYEWDKQIRWEPEVSPQRAWSQDDFRNGFNNKLHKLHKLHNKLVIHGFKCEETIVLLTYLHNNSRTIVLLTYLHNNSRTMVLLTYLHNNSRTMVLLTYLHNNSIAHSGLAVNLTNLRMTVTEIQRQNLLVNVLKHRRAY